MKDRRLVKGCLLAVLGASFWALSGVCGQYMFEQKGVDPGQMVALRLLISGGVLLLLTIRKKGRAAFRWERKDTVPLLAAGLLGIAMCQYAYFTSIHYSNAATGTILCYLSPLMVLFFLAGKDRRRPSGTELAALFLAFAGMFLCVTHGDPATLSISPPALFWGMLSAAAFAIYTIQPQKLIQRYGTIFVNAWGMVAGGLVLGCLFRPWDLRGVWDAPAWTAFACIIGLGTVLSFTFYQEGVRLVGAAKGSVLSSVEPIVSTALSVIWLKSSFQPLDYLGFVLIVSTIFMITAGNQLQKLSKRIKKQGGN